MHGYLSTSSVPDVSGAFNLVKPCASMRSRNSGISSSLQQDNAGGTQSRALFAVTRVERSVGLDYDVVLSRRLIQNCCPFLEDVLTLIGSLNNRTWKMGLTHDSEFPLFRQSRPPHGLGCSGVSPRKRVIKPHPLRPLPAMPSVPEHQRTSSHPGNEHGRDHIDSARVRLVEAFFHSQPGELQTTADFVVRRAVHNACEEVLTAVVRPAVAAVIRQMYIASTKIDGPNISTSAHGKIMSEIESTEKATADGAMGTTRSRSRNRLEKRTTWTTEALHDSVGLRAKFLAGRRSHLLAKSSTLALIPHSLPRRLVTLRRSLVTFRCAHHSFAPCNEGNASARHSDVYCTVVLNQRTTDEHC